jgi:hypothetical protein
MNRDKTTSRASFISETRKEKKGKIFLKGSKRSK